MSRMRRGPNALPPNGGGTGRAARRAIITLSRTRRAGASGFIARGFTDARPRRRAGSSTACLRDAMPDNVRKREHEAERPITLPDGDCPYAELAVTTNFSFLRGASHPRELVQLAC